MTSLLAFYLRLTTPRRQSWCAIPLRLIVGCGFIEHGYAKLARGPDSFAAILHALGMPLPALLAWATVVIELFGGFAVLIGALIPIASIPMVIVLLVAIFTVHLPNGFSSIKLQSVDAAGAHFGQPGYETDLLYIAALLAMVLGGSGPLALDRLLFRRFASGCRMVAEPGRETPNRQQARGSTPALSAGRSAAPRTKRLLTGRRRHTIISTLAIFRCPK